MFIFHSTFLQGLVFSCDCFEFSLILFSRLESELDRSIIIFQTSFLFFFFSFIYFYFKKNKLYTLLLNFPKVYLQRFSYNITIKIRSLHFTLKLFTMFVSRLPVFALLKLFFLSARSRFQTFSTFFFGFCFRFVLFIFVLMSL